MRPVRVVDGQWVCVDCLFFIANGDLPDDTEAAARVVTGVEQQAPYVWVCDGPHENEEEGVDTKDFSWTPCYCCGSDLGGSRHRTALIWHPNEGDLDFEYAPDIEGYDPNGYRIVRFEGGKWVEFSRGHTFARARQIVDESRAKKSDDNPKH